jgi:hypothetical protein
MRIFSSAENWRRVARRISLTTCSAGSFTGPDFCPIFAPSMATMGQKSSLPQHAPDAGHFSSSAENCRRVARRISFTNCSTGSFTGPGFYPIFAPSMATMGQKSSLPQPACSVS